MPDTQADTYDWPTIKAMADEQWPNWTWRDRNPFRLTELHDEREARHAAHPLRLLR